jgi:hypothetical protein
LEGGNPYPATNNRVFLNIGGSAPTANITEKTDALCVLLHMGGGKNTTVNNLSGKRAKKMVK